MSLDNNTTKIASVLAKVNALPAQLDTSDATAAAGDIVRKKTAYVNGEKVTGTLPPGVTAMMISAGFSPQLGSYLFTGQAIYDGYVKADSTAVSLRLLNANAAGVFGDAAAGDVAAGKTFTSGSGIKQTGTKAEPSGSLSITENGTYDVTDKASAEVNVEGIDELAGLIDGVTTVNSLPSGITKIASYAFRERTNLAFTSLPSGVTSIGSYAFFYCTNLALTSLPNGLTSIGNYAFQRCTNLALTSLPSGLTSIGNFAFQGCTNLALTSLPSGLTSIGANVFYDCTNLALTSIPSGVKTLGNSAFYNCTGLTTLTFEGTPNIISASAFFSCTNLTDIYVPWAEGALTNAPWGATNATVHYNS